LLISSGPSGGKKNAGGGNAGDANLSGLDRDKVVSWNSYRRYFYLAAIANSNGKSNNPSHNHMSEGSGN